MNVFKRLILLKEQEQDNSKAIHIKEHIKKKYWEMDEFKVATNFK